MDVVINYWAVIGATIVAFVLGGVWFGPLFGKQWMRLVGITHEQMEAAKEKGVKGMWRSYALMAVGTLVMAYVLAHVIAYAAVFSGSSGADAGIAAGVSVWVGFVAPVMLGTVLWEGRPWKYWFITGGYYLVSLIVMGIILATA
jgi:hypothetical protein